MQTELAQPVSCQRHPSHPDYSIGSDGSVWSEKRKSKKQLRAWVHKGYEWVSLDGSHYPVHRLVLEVFVGPRPLGLECLHINGVKTCNALANLRWGTHAENFADQVVHGTNKLNRGGRHSAGIGRKINRRDAKEIRRLHALGVASQRAIARQYEISQSMVSRIVTTKNWTE